MQVCNSVFNSAFLVRICTKVSLWEHPNLMYLCSFKIVFPGRVFHFYANSQFVFVKDMCAKKKTLLWRFTTPRLVCVCVCTFENNRRECMYEMKFYFCRKMYFAIVKWMCRECPSKVLVFLCVFCWFVWGALFISRQWAVVLLNWHCLRWIRREYAKSRWLNG